MKKINLIEWLWKTDSHEKQKPQHFARYAAMLIMLLTLGVGQMWAWNYNYPYVYFNNSGNWSQVMFLVGNEGASEGWNMSQVSDTKLWYVQATSNWGNSLSHLGMGFCDKKDWKKEDVAFNTRWGYVEDQTSNRTAKIYDSQELVYGTYYFTSSGTSSLTYQQCATSDNCGSVPKYNAIQAAKKRDTGTAYSDVSGSYPATLQLKGTHLSAQGTSSRNTIERSSSSDGPTYTTYGTVVTGLVTHKLKDATLSSDYYFEGWGTGSTPSVTTATHSYNISEATTTYAFFSKLYTLGFDVKGTPGTSTIAVSVANYDDVDSGDKVPTGHTISATATIATGYEIVGWYSDASCTSAYTNGSGGVTISGAGNKNFSITSLNSNSGIYCKFRKKTYSITLDKGDGDSDGEATIQYGDGQLSISSAASYDGWNLTGYYAEGTGTKVADEDGNLEASVGGSRAGTPYSITNSSSKWIYDGNLTIYAHWAQTYTVSYNAGGGSGSMSSNTGIASGGSQTISANSFTRTGYTFSHWTANVAVTANSSSVAAGGTIAAGATLSNIGSNIILTAHWTENDYTVTVNAGSNGSVASTSVTGHYDTKVDLPDATANTGYHFSTWTTTSGSVTYTNQTSATEAQVNGLTAAATVRADFAANTYSVVFDKNGGTGTMTNESFTYGVSKALTSNSYTKSGYTFIGWATSSSRASSLTVDYTNGQSVSNLTSTNGGTYTLYAVWAKDYYLGGRVNESWDASSTTHKFTYVSGGQYKWESSMTVAALSGTYDSYPQYFFVHEGSGTSGTYYTSSSSNGHSFQTNFSSNKLTLASGTNTNEDKLIKFSNVDNLSSNVIIWWEPSTKKIWYEATTSLNTNYFLLGFGSGNWSTTDARRFKVASVNASTATVSVSLTAKTYTGNDDGFKLYYDTWYGNNGTMARANCSGWVFSTSEGNCGITADLAGTYTFTLNLSTKAISVTYPTAYQLNYSIGSVAGTDGSISTSPSTSSGSYVGSGNSVTLTGPEAKTGYTWKGWYTNAAGSEGKIADESRAITVTMNADKTLYACYTENSYSTNVAVSPAAKGSITDPTPAAGKIDVSHHTGTSVTATAITNYVFDHWGVSGGGLTVNSTTANPATFKATSASGTITAYFEDQWCIKGDQWDSWSTSKGLPNTAANTYSASFTLTKGQKYKFKVHDRKTNTWYGNTKDAGEHAMGRGDAAYGTANNGGNDDNLTITPDVTGDYTFSFNTSTKKITVTYPTAYTVTFGAGTINGSDAAITASATPSFSSGDYVLPETDITFSKGSTKDGYIWNGWYSNVGGTGDAWSTTDASLSLTDTRTSNISVYACYTLNNYTITYNLNGGTNHPSNPANFNVETSTITLQDPTKTGYTFRGWYTDADLETEGSTIAVGTYANQEFWAKWEANTYTITLNQNGATTESTPTSLTATYDGKANGASDQFTLTNPEKTGYTFAGWYESEGGTGAEIITTAQYYKWEGNPYVTTKGLWQHDGNVTVYAKWEPIDYTVTLSTTGETGYGSNAPANQTATFDAAMPTIIPPVGAPGYKFQGYFTEANGAGIKYYNANGTSAHAWDIASATTLHAYFLEAEITSLEHESSVAKADVAELVVNPVLNVVPENYIAICWTLHYADNDNPVDAEHWSVAAYTEGGTKLNQVKYTFTNLANGNYYVKATLRKSASAFSNICSDGTRMMDIHGDFHVVGNNTVTVRYMTTDLSSDFVLKAPTEVEVEAMSTVEVTAPEIPGYTFTRWSIGDGISTSDAVTANPITISATYDGVLTARYTKKQMIYFNNTLGWDTVYVYFYNNGNYWGNANQGTGSRTDAHDGAYTGKHGGMTKIAGTNIYYFDLAANSVSLSLTNVAFTEKEQIDELYFSANNVIGRGDYSAALSMYVPLAGVDPVTKNGTGEYQSFYYEKGYWMNYPESTGYELRFYNKRASDGSGEPYELIAKRHKFEFTGDKTLPLSVSLDLEAGHDYFFKVYRVDGTYYGNNQQMTNGHSGDEGQPAWEFKTGTENAWVTASGAGNYTFTLTYGIDLSSNYNYLVGVRYPESTGDFRVLYSDAVRVSTHESDEGKSWLASYVIPKTSESDTVSYFVRSASSPKIKAQKCTATYEDETTTVTWTDENEGVDLLPDTISADGVYNFIFTKSGDNLVLSAVEPYTGNFYIRVDGAGSSNWDNFRAADHLMPYSDYSFHQTENPYSHYFTQWYEPNPDGKPVEPKNIKFVVANDYSACVSDTIVRDGIADNYVDENGWLSGRNANIRFMYNYKTNEASRRYIDGAQESGTEFLVLIPEEDDMIYDAETEGTAYPQVTFTDKGNWLYEANVWVVPGTTYKLKSQFGVAPNLVEQYFKGAESGAGEYETLIGGSGSSRLQIRLLYDFKTNRLVSAYIPSSTISSDLAINADVMFIREGQGEMQQLTFENDATLSAITNVYSVLRFNKWTLNNRYTTGGHGLVADPKSIYERSLYFVSFPFDVKLSDVFGFGTYWDEWYIEYYDGAARAKNGFWIDSDSYWKYVTPAMKDTFTLKAGQGYIFGLDLDYLHCEGEGEGQQANVWKNIQTADFIFPGNVSSISNSSVTYTLPAHTCTINRGTASGNRTIADSHWNVLGVPTYLNTTSVTFEETTGDWMTDGKPKYIYSWNPQDNSLSPTSAADFTYHSMNAYVVQYYGNVTFSTSVSPTAAPRRNPEYRGEYEFRLEIRQNEQAIDHTFIRLTDDEEATVNFEFGLDLTKSINANKANIYTIVEGYLQAAGNCLPLTDQTTVVPVGVIAKTTGDYTFSIPEGTEGVGVTLIDNETGIRTSLSALDYNINLNAGTYDNRFILEISPIQQMPTNVEVLNGGNGENGVRKVLIDGLLYIVKDGKIFDAQGKRLQ